MGIYAPTELIEMVTHADITIMNEPESIQFREMTGEDFVTLALAHGHTGITTLGEK